MAPTRPSQEVGHYLAERLIEEVTAWPDGNTIKSCIQCGSCSGSCPSARAMDYTPRQIFAALRSDRIDLVLSSNTMWLCASCYACSVRCPAGIKITDVMYSLKRMAVRTGLAKSGARSLALYRSFVDSVDRTGRNSELEFLARYFTRTSPVSAAPPGIPPLRMAPLGAGLFGKRRIPIRPEGVSDIVGFRRIMAQARFEDMRLEAQS